MSCGLFTAVKDPDADLDYVIDWTAWLGSDTISSSAWALPSGSGLVQHDAAVLSGNLKTRVWLRGGLAANVAYRVTNSIVTAGGRKEDRSILFTVKER